MGSLRPILERIPNKPRKSNAGRKAIDVVVMFKLLVLQQLYNISGEELEYQVSDRLSFIQFMGFGLADEVPDAIQNTCQSRACVWSLDDADGRQVCPFDGSSPSQDNSGTKKFDLQPGALYHVGMNAHNMGSSRIVA